MKKGTKKGISKKVKAPKITIKKGAKGKKK